MRACDKEEKWVQLGVEGEILISSSITKGEKNISFCQMNSVGTIKMSKQEGKKFVHQQSLHYVTALLSVAYM